MPAVPDVPACLICRFRVLSVAGQGFWQGTVDTPRGADEKASSFSERPPWYSLHSNKSEDTITALVARAVVLLACAGRRDDSDQYEAQVR